MRSGVFRWLAHALALFIIALPVNSVLLHQPIKRDPGDVQMPRGLRDVIAHLKQCVFDGLFLGIGARFRVIVSVLGTTQTIDYCITRFDRPYRLELAGGDASIRSIDQVTFASRPGGARITSSAQLELSGICRLANPLLDLLLKRVGSLAMRGLRERLDRQELVLMKDNHSNPMKESDQ